MAPAKLFAITCLVLMMPAGEAMSVARRHERARHNPPVAAIISEKGISSLLPISIGSNMLPAAGAGGVMGFCTGKAVKIGGNVAAIAVGGLYVVATVLQKAGYVTINYHKIEADVTKLMDLNKDGKVDQKDYEFLSDKTAAILADNSLGTSGGFAAGFALGLKL